jgi:hypothetical protein
MYSPPDAALPDESVIAEESIALDHPSAAEGEDEPAPVSEDMAGIEKPRRDIEWSPLFAESVSGNRSELARPAAEGELQEPRGSIRRPQMRIPRTASQETARPIAPYRPLIEPPAQTEAPTEPHEIATPAFDASRSQPVPVRQSLTVRTEPDAIEIHIGRIEVTAVTQSALRPPVPPRKALNLEEYLKRRDGSRR